jgi:hypothetical protein
LRHKFTEILYDAD